MTDRLTFSAMAVAAPVNDQDMSSKLIELQKMRWCRKVEQVIVAVLQLSQYIEFKNHVSILWGQSVTKQICMDTVLFWRHWRTEISVTDHKAVIFLK